MKITFFGAARGVTGSCHMVEACGKKFLVDCGMFQGTLTEQLLNYDAFPFNISEIDFILLTHAHIDHSGRIPKLYREGYKNPIYATKATCDLLTIMLPDSGHIQEKEIEWVNRKRLRAGKKPTNPLYTAEDGVNANKLFEVVDYDQKIKVGEGLEFRMVDAGHMLGSAIVEVWATEDGKVVKTVFSGDLGNSDMPIIKNPEIVEDADYMVLESTYGGRFHGKIEDQSAQLLSIIIDTIERGGNVVIPSFAVGRTQEMLYEINKYVDSNDNKINKLKNIPVYVDSPLAVNATKIFEKNPDCYNEDALKYLLKGDDPLNFKNLHFITSAEDSKAINENQTPKIIISASGMCEAGRIKHHLKHNLWRADSTILFVGYQAEGTLGRRLVSGEKLVKIFGEEIGVNAKIENLDAFSGHADQAGLIRWVDTFKGKPKKIFLVHGEYTGQLELQNEIQKVFNIESLIPERNECYDMNGTCIKEKGNLKYVSTRFEVLELLSYLKDDVDEMTNTVKTEIKQNADDKELAVLKQKLDELKKIVDTLKANKIDVD